MLFYSFHSGTHFNHVNQARQMVSRWEPPGTPQIFHFFHSNHVFHFFQGVGSLKSFISFISIVFFRVRNALFLSFLCVFHFFQGAECPILFISLCFSFLSGCGMVYFFHFFVFFISFRVWNTLFRWVLWQ